MNTWKPAALDLIQHTPDLYVSPFRADGTTYGTPTRTWALVVDGHVYVRAATGPSSSWYLAAMTQGAGRVRIDSRYYDVTFASASAQVAPAIDAAYEVKYPGSSAVAIMQGDAPTAATVIISPR